MKPRPHLESRPIKIITPLHQLVQLHFKTISAASSSPSVQYRQVPALASVDLQDRRAVQRGISLPGEVEPSLRVQCSNETFSENTRVLRPAACLISTNSMPVLEMPEVRLGEPRIGVADTQRVSTQKNSQRIGHEGEHVWSRLEP